MSVLVIAEHADGAVKPATLTTVGAATKLGGDLHILVVGSDVQAQPRPPRRSRACPRCWWRTPPSTPMDWPRTWRR